MRYIKLTIVLMVSVLFSTSLLAQNDPFVRSAVIPVEANDVGGFGGVVSGVDFDNDGLPEIYAVNNDWNDEVGKDLIPRIYKYENDGSGWNIVWSATLPAMGQNTWPALTYGDIDGDGKMEIWWGPVNNSSQGDTVYSRIIVFEEASGDTLGVPDGSGNFRPNATWTITDEANYNLRPFRWFLNDVDNDGTTELVFGARAGADRFGVVSVDNIPDNGDSTETWTMEESGLDTNLTIDGGTIYDLAIIDSTIYLIHDSGNITPIMYANGTWSSGAILTNAVPGGSWKSSSVVDLNGDGKDEIIVGGWLSSSDAKVNLLQETTQGVLTTTVVSDLTGLMNGGRIYGGAAGDIDNDGNMDFVFGSRGGTPNAAIIRVAFTGGDITDPANYVASRIDDGLFSSGGRFDVIDIANLDSDPDLEVVYSGIPASSPVPLVILDRVAVPNLITIAAARVDADSDNVPDLLDSTVTVVGVVNAVNIQGTARFSYTIEDATGGITLFNGSIVGPVLPYGTRVSATGKVAFFNGTTEIDVADPDNDVSIIDTGKVLIPANVTIESYLANAEMYESRLIKIKAVAKTSSSAAWPASGSSANMTIWDGNPSTSLTLRVDGDTNLDDNPEPTYPINVTGVGSQFTSAAPYNDGYQITPSFYSQIEQGVAAPPSPYFSILAPANNSEVTITDSSQTVDFTWEKPVDFNGDALIYQVKLLSPAAPAIGVGDTTTTLDGATILGLMGGADTVAVTFTVITKGAEADLVPSKDTVTVTFINGIVVGINDNQQLPTTFYVNQNYPNPFNPTTTISFGLPNASNVDLRIFNILGQQVAVLINNQTRNAGRYNVSFDASNFASGTYIYRLTSGSNVVTKKMILMK